RKEKLHLYRGHARFVGPHQVTVGEKVLEGRHIFIDTGTHASTPRIEGLDTVGYLTNKTIMELTELPEHLLVLGGGYIGLEFSQMFRRFGSRVTVVHSGDQLLNREDRDVAEELQKAVEAEGVRFVLNAKTSRAERKKDQVALTVELAPKAGRNWN